jgi:peptide/nickel transport system substrate-binding protein
MEQKHRTVRGILIYGCLISLLCAGIFCCIAGCISGTATTNGGSGKISETPVATTDVIIPLSSASEMTYTSSMQKKSVPYGVYEGLVIKDRFGQFSPSLAETWDVSADAKTWTFHLAENAVWSDGVSFTCDDVKFTNDYMKAYNLTLGFVLKDVQSVECRDEHTAVFTLKTSYSGFLDQISRQPGITISAKHFWENITDPQHYTDTKFTGTGPFVFVKAEPGYVQMKTNTAYYGHVPRVSGIVFKLITNPDSQVLALRNGEVDVVSGLSPAVAQSLAVEKTVSVYTINDTGAYEVAFNMARYPSNISAFRQAMSHAVDRKTIVSIFGTGHPTDTTFLIPALAGDYVNPADVGMYDYNLTKAQTMLETAGFMKNPDGKLIGPDGKPVTITIPYSSGSKGGSGGSSGNQKVLTVLKNDWERLGIAVTTLSFDDQTQYRNAVNQYPVFIDAFPVTLHDDADALVNFAVTPTQESNYYNYNNAEYNSLVTRIQNTVDKAEIRRLAYRMQDILAQDIPTVPVCTTDTLVAYRNDRFTGWDIGPGYHSITDPLVLENLTPVRAS